jgi:hypothetical protein
MVCIFFFLPIFMFCIFLIFRGKITFKDQNLKYLYLYYNKMRVTRDTINPNPNMKGLDFDTWKKKIISTTTMKT